MKRTFALLALSFLLAGPSAPAQDAPATQPVSLWDSARYIHISEVKPGMTGYGLTVFSGTKIEKFDVEVLDVLKNFNPKCDVILISCKGPYLEHVGSVAGMSGSPIYLYDETDTEHKHPRMAGAFAYGWPLAKDPVAGVQPIEYMLKIPPNPPAVEGNSAAAANSAHGDIGKNKADGEISRPQWSLADVPALPGFKRNGAGLIARTMASTDLAAGPPSPVDDEAMRLQPLATPLTASGLSPATVKQLRSMFSASGLQLMEGGGSAGSTLGDPNAELEPGSVLAVPLLTGDTELSAIGTCTEVRGDRIFGFGHSFENEGPINLPMASGKISTVVANIQTSFKLGAMTKMRGTLTADQTVGVAGKTGDVAPMVPIELHVHYADGTLDQTYHFQAAVHPKFTAMVTGAAVTAALGGIKELPQYHTLDYDLSLDFGGEHSVHIVNTGVNGGAAEVFQQIGLPIMAASDNPFKKVAIKKISGTINVISDARVADITSITVPKLKYEPGEVVKAFVNYRPWRGSEQTMNVTFDLPKDLPNGQYQLIVSDWERYFSDERQAEPFRFTAESIDELFAVVKDFEAIRHNAL